MDLGNIDEDSLCYLSRYFNKNFISTSSLRKRQDGKYISKLRRRAFEKMNGGITISDPKLFYVGCVDFMVTETNGKRQFVILETNGGSSRGILALAAGQTEMIFNAYKLAIDSSTDIDDHKLVLIGTVPQDSLFQEKILLVEFLKQRYIIEGYQVGVYNSFTFDPEKVQDEDITFVITNYSNLLEDLSFKNDHVIFKGERVDTIIGDGVARRFPIVGAYIKNDWEKVKTVIVNPIYQISDDKANTYLAIRNNMKNLEPYRIKDLSFGKAGDPYQLERYLERIITKYKKNYIIKPFGGSGGVGIQPVSPNFNEERGHEIMERSISEFYQKFDARRSPFPYTIQEMADFSFINFENSKRTYDIRIYVVQRDGKFYPVGGEGRVARLPYTGGLIKEEFVVNISGFNGVEINRVIPFSQEGLEKLNLGEEDLIDMFCASCETFKAITENFRSIIKFKNWDEYLTEENELISTIKPDNIENPNP